MQSEAGRGLNSVIEAARILKFEQHYVYMLIWKGKLSAAKQGGRWRILGSALRRFNERRKDK